MKLPISEVKEDPTLQLRDGLDMDRVRAMMEFETEGGHLPAVIVVGNDNLLGDGHHRLLANIKLGRKDIEAERVPGGRPEAIAIAITRNDIATSMPLTRTQRNAGIKVLLQAGWTQERIAKVTGVSTTTIRNIANALAMRGEAPKASKAAGSTGGHPPKQVAVLPKAVHEKLNDTTLTRIADMVPVEKQGEFAKAVADANLSEPRVREAIKVMRDKQLSPTAAVDALTPKGVQAPPKSIGDVTKQVHRRLDDFLSETMTIDGIDRDFWAVLDVLVANAGALNEPQRNGLASLLADISVKTDRYATALRSHGGLKAVAG